MLDAQHPRRFATKEEIKAMLLAKFLNRVKEKNQ
jgi:hypothetical protein